MQTTTKIIMWMIKHLLINSFDHPSSIICLILACSTTNDLNLPEQVSAYQTINWLQQYASCRSYNREVQRQQTQHLYF